ncbi:MAG: hypothetical protein FWF59_08260 [Turicibacter sp.]|nr:hypothetical protein [Turicibacter sp.]
MKKIMIDPALKAKLPDFEVAVMSFEVEPPEPSDESLQEEMADLGNAIKTSHSLESLLQEPRIKAARDSYKALGKDPSRYRLATEALLRRLIKGSGLYQINNLVDMGNILSVNTRRSIGTNEAYEGIGRGAINIENIPVYVDDIGPFGTPTSDTDRTRITDKTTQVLLFIISFDGEAGLHEDVRLAIDYYTRYANASNFTFETAD